MKRVVLFLIYVILVIGYSGGVNFVKAQEDKSKPVIFLLAHQDDEMFLAGEIKKQVEEGGRVYVVMVTDGGASQARKILNRKKNCVDALRMKKITSSDIFLTRQAFSAARNREFVASMKSLGVTLDHIIFANPGGVEGTRYPLYEDGKLTEKKAQEVVAAVVREYGDGVYFTLATHKVDAEGKIRSSHRDHKALSVALAQFEGISEKHFFSESPTPHERKLSHSQYQAKHRALYQYFVCKPQQGRYAVGTHSVDYLFNEWIYKKVEYEAK